MTQTALVKCISSDGMAEVSVHRKSACSHDCSKCAGCETMFPQSDITVKAENHLDAHPGDVVLVESANSEIIFAAFVVYVVPFILFFAGYLLGGALSMGEGLSVLIAFAGFAVGFLPARKLEKRMKEKKPVQFNIVEIVNACSDI